jgi:amidase
VSVAGNRRRLEPSAFSLHNEAFDMGPEEYASFDATGLAALVRRGEVTASELTEAAIERIDALNPRLNAVVERDYDGARAAARAAGRSAPLAGVPFLAKDMNIEVAGMHLTASCRWLDGLPPATTDAPLAARWRSAGLCLLGRTNTPEFAGEFVTEPKWRGPTHNPWDLARSPGGSSGGAAAAVASGMVPMAHGNDLGGSIRVPAAACGLVRLKPSRGWVPVGPRHDELAGGLNCEHVLTRTVRDSALMLEVTSGAEPTTRYPLKTYAPTPALSRLRIGVALRAPGGIGPIDEIGAAVEHAAAAVSRAGHTVIEYQFPDSANIGEASGLIWMVAIAEEIAFYRGLIGRDPRADELEALPGPAWISPGAAAASTMCARAARSRRRLAAWPTRSNISTCCCSRPRPICRCLPGNSAHVAYRSI